MGRVQDRVAIVTGSAKGMGAAIMRVLAREGAHVIGGDIDETLGNKVVEEIADKGGNAHFVRHDVSDEASWERIVQYAREHYGALHIHVNNAGYRQVSHFVHEIHATQRSRAHGRAVIAVPPADQDFLLRRRAVRTSPPPPFAANIANLSSSVNRSGLMGVVSAFNTVVVSGSGNPIDIAIRGDG